MSLLIRIAYFQIWGKPVIFYSGILTLLSFTTTASIMIFSKDRLGKSFKRHKRMAAVSFILATIHAILGISLYL